MAKLPSQNKITEHVVLQLITVAVVGFFVLVIRQGLKRTGNHHLVEDFKP